MDFELTLKKLKESIFAILGDEYIMFHEETEKDLETFFKKSREKLERWSNLLSSEEITLEEYEWLVKSQKDLIVLTELEKVGVSKIRLGHIRNNMAKTIIDIGKGLLLNIK